MSPLFSTCRGPSTLPQPSLILLWWMTSPKRPRHLTGVPQLFVLTQLCSNTLSSHPPLSSHHIHFLVSSAPLNFSRFNALCLHFFSPDSLTLICWLYAPPPKTSKVARDFLSTKRTPFLSSHLSASVLFLLFFKPSLLTCSPWFLRFFSTLLAPLCSLRVCFTVDSLLDSGLS